MPVLLKEKDFYFDFYSITVPAAYLSQDLLTLEDGTVCNTFKETVKKRRFIQNDEEWIECMSEAAASGSPSQLRLLFATILLFCEPAEPVKLWNQFYPQLSENLRTSKYNLKHSDKGTLHKILLLIDDQLKAHGKTLQNFPEMAKLFATVTSSIHIPVPNIIEEELSYYEQEFCNIVLEHEKKMFKFTIK